MSNKFMPITKKRSGGPITSKGGSMLRNLGWPSAGMVIGCLALIVAVGGTGYAASGDGSPNATAASSSKAAGSARSAKATVARHRGRRGPRGRRGRAGPRGPAGPAGPKGAPGAPGTEAAHDPILGSWIVTTNRGPTLPPVKSLQTFSRGGGLVTVQNIGATVASPAHGAWERTGPRRYATTFVFFRYDPTTGANIGTTKLRCTLELAADRNAFTSVCSPEFRNAAGDLEPGSNTRRDPGTAERINVEAIPALP